MKNDAGTVLALDVGGTKTSIAAFHGAPAEGLSPLRTPLRLDTPRDPEEFLDAIVAAAKQALPEREAVAAVGIGVPGPLDVAHGRVETSPNIGWRDFPIASLVSERFGGVPVAIDDDANTGALGEAIMGAGRDADPFVYLPLGTGLGAGVVIGGRIIGGAHGAAGEVGHMAVDNRVGPRCNCGRRNCVEAWCGGAGLARRARETWPSQRLPDGSASPRRAESVFALARKGDPDALELIARARHALAVGMAAIMSTIDPAAVSVGGTIGISEPGFVREAYREATRMVHRTAGLGVKLRAPELGGSSVLAGAAVLGARASSVA